LGRFAIDQLGTDAARIFVRTITERFEMEAKDLKRESRLFEDLGADSLDVVETFMRFEDELDVTISDDEQGKIKTLGEAIEALARALRGNMRRG
jgi:acyl carrier protein